jgi:hypothetical protein
MIKYKALVFVLLVAIKGSLFSQDRIYRKNRRILPVEVLTSNSNFVTFKIYNDPNQFKQKIPWTEIDSIVFQDGFVQKQNSYFNQNKIFSHDFDPSAVGLKYPKPNILYFDFIDLLMFNNIGIGYEHMFIPKLTSLSLNFSKSFIRKTDEWPDPYDKFFYPNLELRMGANLYFVNSGNLNYGISAIYNLIFYDRVTYNYDNSIWMEDASFSHCFGFGLFGRYHFSNLITSKLGVDVYYSKSENFPIFFIPHLSLGINF